MSKHVPFLIKSGIPFSKTIVATLPTGRSWWNDAVDFEVLAQIREGDTYESPLILDIAQFITTTFNPLIDADEVTLELFMTGADTRLVTTSGFYDIILSDVLAVDDRAIQVVNGPVQRTAVVSSDTVTL